MKNSGTRFLFRFLAGLMGAFLLLFSLPVSLLEVPTEPLKAGFIAACCLFGGIGLGLGAYTGRWFNSSG